MAGFMKNAMSYLGMSDVAEGEDDFEDDVDTGETSFDSDHSVTPMPSSSASASTPSAPREQSNPFQGGRVSRITTIHPKTYDDAQMVFGVRGSIERVTPRVFLLSPAQVNIKVEEPEDKGPAHDLFAD